VGGMNVANEYFRIALKPAQRWRDQDLLVRGAAVTDIASGFDRNYDFFKSIKTSKPDLFNTDKAWSNWRKQIVQKFGTLKVPYDLNRKLMAMVQKLGAAPSLPEGVPAKVRFVQNRPRLGETFIRQVYLQMIGRARDEVLIENAYFVPSKELVTALGAAVKRGVSVTVLTNSLETNDLPQLAYVSRHLYKDLLALGVKVYEWTGPKVGEGTVHAKFAIFDRRSVIGGSYNLDPRSDLLNSETVVVFESPVLAGELADQFTRQDLAKSTMITSATADEFYRPKNIAEQFKLLFALPLTDWL
jgi:putative cardiolipin synthase